MPDTKENADRSHRERWRQRDKARIEANAYTNSLILENNHFDDKISSEIVILVVS